MNVFLTILFSVLIFSIGHSQNYESSISQKQSELELLKKQQEQISSEIEALKLDWTIDEMKSLGLPSDNYHHHAAMAISYSDEHKQPSWVAHVILPDIINGSLGRTNDFRVDPKVKNGTAVEEDYFLKKTSETGETIYDGFGYDRGHLAPSADFRWSEDAISQSYYYSNISPQLDKFNRGIWKDLEGSIRYYIYQNPDTKLFVVTLPVLKDGLPTIQRSVKNKVSIPEQFVKVVLDLKNEMGIAFVMANENLSGPINKYAVSIDEAEALTGFDFFNKMEKSLQEKIEGNFDINKWLMIDKESSVEAIDATLLNKGQYNTDMVLQDRLKSKKAEVCGTIVNARKSKKGHYWVNLDAPYPNAKFSFWVRKENQINFSVLPGEVYFNQKVCIEGKINNYGDNASMEIMSEDVVSLFSPKK